MPEVKDFSKLKDCDILNLDRLSEPEISDSLSQCVVLSDWLLTSALKLFGQISVTADNSRPGPIPFNQANRLLVYPDNSDLQTFL